MRAAFLPMSFVPTSIYPRRFSIVFPTDAGYSLERPGCLSFGAVLIVGSASVLCLRLLVSSDKCLVLYLEHSTGTISSSARWDSYSHYWRIVLKKHISSALALLAMILLAAGSVDTDKKPPAASNPPPTSVNQPATKSPAVEVSKKWYVGGTLHDKGALDWQNADQYDKLATCGDFVTTLWKSGKLKPEISNSITTIDDLRPYAQELVIALDAACARDPDPDQNRRLFVNQTVSGFAVLSMVTMGWTR